MRTRFLHRLAAILLALLIAGAAFGIETEDLNRVTFVNDTGYDIWYLFFSPGDSEFWGADVLGTTRTLDDGEMVSFWIFYPDSSNEFDFLAIDEDGDEYVIWNYTISDDSEEIVVITLDDYNEDPFFPGVIDDLAEVDIINDTGYDIWFLFFSPADSTMWGIDMLDDETILYHGNTHSLYVPRGDGVVYDILGKDEDDDEYILDVEISSKRDQYEVVIQFEDISY